MLNQPVYDVTKKPPLSNSTVQRRIDEMAKNVGKSLCEYLKISKFALQLDESTLPGNESLLLSYVRSVKDGKPREELLFAKTLKMDTKGETIFQTLEDFLAQKKIILVEYFGCSYGWSPSHGWSVQRSHCLHKKKNPGIIAVHCVIHRQHLVAKNLSERLHKSLQLIITTRDGEQNKEQCFEFKQLCMDNEEDFNRLLLHTEVRWL